VSADGLITERRGVETRPLLRVLAGPNSGAEAPLDAGNWVIGTGADADLTFAEPALAAAHVRIGIAATGLRITALADGVRVGATLLAPGAETDLPPLCPVGIGGTVFAIGPAGSDWTSVRTAEPVAPPPAAVEAGPGEPPREAAAPEPAAAPPPGRSAAAVSPARRRLRWVLPLAAALALLLMGAGLLLALWGSPAPVPEAMVDPLARARAVIAALKLPDVTAETANGRVAVSGYVPTASDLRALVNGLRAQGVDASMSVTSEASLVDSAVTVLKAYGLDVTVRADGPGRIALSGYTDDATKLKDVLQHLKMDVVGLRAINDGVVTLQRAREALDQALATAGLAGIVRVETVAGTIRVSGALDQAGMARWAGVAERFRSQFGQYVKLDTQFMTPAVAAPRGVHLGRAPYIVTDNGSRLGIGDMLGTSGRITAIRADGLTLSTATGTINVPYARTPNWILEDTK
jgi:type III secretion system YscD/HrpQ family protein